MNALEVLQERLQISSNISGLSSLSSGLLGDFWRFCLPRIYSKQEARVIKQQRSERTFLGSDIPTNIGQYSSDPLVDAQICNMKQRYNEASNSLRILLNQISNSKEQIKKIQIELSKTEHDFSETQRSIEFLNRRRITLLVFRAQIRKLNLRLAEFSTQLKSRSFSKHPEDLNSATEDVLACWKQIADFLQDSASHPGDDASNSSLERSHVKGGLNQVFQKHRPVTVLNCLLCLLRSSTLGLRETTALIDVNQELKALKLTYDSHSRTLAEVSPLSEDSFLSVTKLLQMGQRDHFEKFIRSQDMKNRNNRLIKAANADRQDCSRSLHQLYTSSSTKTASLAKTLFDLQCSLIEIEAKLSSLIRHKTTLEEELKRQTELKSQLYKDHRQIAEFSLTVQNRQDSIRALVERSINGKKRLQQQQAEVELVLKYININLSTRRADIRAVSSLLRGTVDQQVSKFWSIPPSHLSAVSHIDHGGEVVNMPLHLLSIHRFKFDPHLREIAQILKYPGYNDSQFFLEFIVVLMRSVSVLAPQPALDLHVRLTDYQLSVSQALKTVEESKQQLITKTTEFNDNWDSRIAKRRQIISASLTECDNLPNLIRVWWIQPAQHLTPWKTVDGKSLQDWLHDWHLLWTNRKRCKTE